MQQVQQHFSVLGRELAQLLMIGLLKNKVEHVLFGIFTIYLPLKLQVRVHGHK